MKKRKRFWALTIGYIIITILTMVSVFLCLLKVETTHQQDDILDFGPLFDLAVAYVFGIIFVGILCLCEYGIYSSLRYLLVEEREGATRFIGEVLKLVICLFIFVERIIAVHQ